MRARHRGSAGRVGAGLALALAVLLLAGCGGSSRRTISIPSTTPNSSTAQSPGALSGRVAALRACLQRNGIEPPKAQSGSQLPPGVSRERYEAVLRRCGASSSGSSSAAALTPALKQALASFAQCMRAHGVNHPEPNTSGNGPIFETRGLDTTSPAYKAARAACISNLTGAVVGTPPAAAGKS